MTAEVTGFRFPPSETPPAGDQRSGLKPSVTAPCAETFALRPNIPGGRYVPIDPFDPEIFNRRYFR